MRVHFICKRYYTNKDLFQDRFGRLYHLPLELARQGVQVSVDAIDYKNLYSEKLDIEGVTFQSIPAVPLKLFALPFSLASDAYNIKPDIIIASGDSHIGFIAMRIARKLGARFVFDVYDYYPAFKGNVFPGMKMFFRRSVEGANLVLCASNSLMHKLHPINSNQLLIENGVNLDLFSPSDMLAARKELCLSSKYQLIGYFGSIDQGRGPLLIEACRLLQHEFPALRLILAGRVFGVNVEEPWIIYYGELSQSKIPVMINACDVVALPYAETPFNSMCGACKIAEYLACGKPVVATRVSDHANLFADAPSSLCDQTPESMAAALRLQLLRKAYVDFPQHFSWGVIGSKLHGSLQSLTKS